MSMTTPDNVNNHRYRNYGDPISMFDRGAESRVKGSAVKRYGTAAAKLYLDGEVDAAGILGGALAAHSYDNFDKTQVSNQDYVFHPGGSR